ncbi:hypothetical protein ARMSODRAFT_1034177 [Armillaria solidipes]|uniref:Uncharacterized protein n=1 Tax=Armillaria solidipes TaxID=1076256 RepID=A0A2H3C4B7_9AGAR|nr:hypothetical protein ARMSODRAFT_1034177 [Armillaria solidipes]
MDVPGISLAISHAPPLSPLVLYVPSKSLIEDICLRAAQLTLHGSVAKDSDLFSILVTTIANRICPIHFRIPSEKSAPTSQAAYARQLARDVVREHNATHGIFLGLVDCAPPSCAEDDLTSLKESGTPSDKVTSDLTPTKDTAQAGKPSPVDIPLPTDTDSDSESHRGRSKVRERMWSNLQQLVNCASGAHMWKLVRKWTDPHSDIPSIPLEDFGDTFRKRMNPDASSHHIDPVLKQMSDLLAASLPDQTQDNTPLRSFSRSLQAKDVDQGKDCMRENGANAAAGVDEVSQRDVLAIPTDDLCA